MIYLWCVLNIDTLAVISTWSQTEDKIKYFRSIEGEQMGHLELMGWGESYADAIIRAKKRARPYQKRWYRTLRNGGIYD